MMIDITESPLSPEPRYRINAVAEMTGLSAPNLRAWERRYGIPSPQRGENAYRLYSNKDITLLRKMKSLCDQGHAPSDAAKLAHAHFEKGIVKSQDSTPVGMLETRRALVQAAQDFNPTLIEQLLARSIALGSAWQVYQEILEPALTEIGDLWEKDHRFLANEHILSQAIKSTLNQLIKIIRPPKPRKRVLLACVSGEQHDLPLYALAIRASHAGCLPIILGANTPPEALSTAIENIAPHVIALSATTSLTLTRYNDDLGLQEPSEGVKYFDAPQLAAELERYHSACRGRTWLIGGRSIMSWGDLPSQLSSHVNTDLDAFDSLLL